MGSCCSRLPSSADAPQQEQRLPPSPQQRVGPLAAVDLNAYTTLLRIVLLPTIPICSVLLRLSVTHECWMTALSNPRPKLLLCQAGPAHICPAATMHGTAVRGIDTTRHRLGIGLGAHARHMHGAQFGLGLDPDWQFAR